jgi:heme-degrading monooxygenase HmoA
MKGEYRMKIFQWMLAALMVCAMGVAVQVHAQEAESDEVESAEEDEKISAMLKKVLVGVEDVTGKVTFNAEDLALVMKHWESFDDTFDAIEDSSIGEAHKKMSEHQEYLDWAKARELDPDDFFRKSMRVLTCYMKLHFRDDMKAAVAEQRKMMESFRDWMEEDEFKEAMKHIEELEADLDACHRVLASVPGPTDDEKKLIEANRKELANLFFDLGDDDEKEDGDEMD